MTFEELKSVMHPDDIHELELKLRQGEIAKSAISQWKHFYSFEFLLNTKYGRMLIAGYYTQHGLNYTCATRVGQLEMFLEWAKSE
ncbi:hypothetical protein [Paenibacillus alvei]|uniref:Uncharacterized protein n=1 Tax=Paenibacillus alvei TaxID=44250 RepID=A0AAP7A4J1_PAEAL|nr:hypothetical protein [Paenibacillus alvei]NOJ74105.1 hypothetical protein [Paenibacillus alvei]